LHLVDMGEMEWLMDARAARHTHRYPALSLPSLLAAAPPAFHTPPSTRLPSTATLVPRPSHPRLCPTRAWRADAPKHPTRAQNLPDPEGVQWRPCRTTRTPGALTLAPCQITRLPGRRCLPRKAPPPLAASQHNSAPPCRLRPTSGLLTHPTLCVSISAASVTSADPRHGTLRPGRGHTLRRRTR